jgi:hypothetical protein
MFVEGAEPLSPFNEHSQYGGSELWYLLFFVVKKDRRLEAPPLVLCSKKIGSDNPACLVRLGVFCLSGVAALTVAAFAAMAATTAFRAGVVGDHSYASGDDTPDRFARLGMFRERGVVHGLADLILLGRLACFLRNGLVNVGWHASEGSQQKTKRQLRNASR